MGKCKILVLSMMIYFPSHAITWQIIGQESKTPVYQGAVTADLKKSLGDLTVKILDENKIPYVGNESGIHSILGTPTGDAAIVVESDTLMRVYGWCVEVDGIQPSVMPDTFFFHSQESILKWFFAYIVNENGEWKNCCTPAYNKPLKP